MTLRFCFFCLLLTFSCTDSKPRRVLAEDVFAEGDITKDTIYNGLIKFYDTASNKLIMTANYKSGIMDGEKIEYYSDGKQKSKVHYENGKPHGEQVIFDSLGISSFRQSYFHGLAAGSSLSLEGDIPKQYYFYSLENDELLHIDYDSIIGKRIEQLSDTSFFFWHLTTFSNPVSTDERTELFIYIPNPPKLNFKYSLCIIDNKYNVKKVVKEFNSDKILDLTSINYQQLNQGELYALRLTVNNEFATDDKEAIMFKKL